MEGGLARQQWRGFLRHWAGPRTSPDCHKWELGGVWLSVRKPGGWQAGVRPTLPEDTGGGGGGWNFQPKQGRWWRKTMAMAQRGPAAARDDNRGDIDIEPKLVSGNSAEKALLLLRQLISQSRKSWSLVRGK